MPHALLSRMRRGLRFVRTAESYGDLFGSWFWGLFPRPWLLLKSSVRQAMADAKTKAIAFTAVTLQRACHNSFIEPGAKLRRARRGKAV